MNTLMAPAPSHIIFPSPILSLSPIQMPSATHIHFPSTPALTIGLIRLSLRESATLLFICNKKYFIRILRARMSGIHLLNVCALWSLLDNWAVADETYGFQVAKTLTPLVFSPDITLLKRLSSIPSFSGGITPFSLICPLARLWATIEAV